MKKPCNLSEKALKAMNVSIEVIKNMRKEELDYIAENNPSARGMITGYTYEYHLEKFLKGIPGITSVYKPDDHDRKRNKSDYIVSYKGKEIRIQSKSIQTNSIREKDGVYTATVQNDSSTKHETALPNGKRIRCTNYVYGGYDILATCIVNFTGNIEFCFKLNSDCSCAKNGNIDQEDRKYLMNTTERITYPLDESWSTDIEDLMNRVKEEKKTENPRLRLEQMLMDL